MMTQSTSSLTPANLLKKFEVAHRIPLIHLAKEFVRSSIAESKIATTKDSKTADTAAATTATSGLLSHTAVPNEDNTHPYFTSSEAFSRLWSRFSDNITSSDHQAFLPWVRELEGRSRHTALHDAEYVILGLTYQWGLGCDRSLTKAVRQYERVKERNGYALTLLGRLYFDGVGIEKDLEKAFLYFSQAAASYKIGLAYNQKGWMYQHGILLQKDVKAAFQNYSLGATTGDAFSLQNLGWCYATELGTSKDLSKAVFYWSQSIVQGNTDALANYAFNILSKEDPQQEVAFYLAGARVGNSTAADNAAFMLEKGEAVSKDVVHAAALYRQAIVLGYDLSKIELTKLHENNLGNYAVCYYQAMASRDLNTLKSLMQNEIAFAALWIKDFYAEISKIQQDAIELAIALLPPDQNTQAITGLNRIRANLAIHFFEKEDIEKACCYLRQLNQEGLFSKTAQQLLSAKESYEIGFWIYTHADAFTIPLATAITPFFERFRTSGKKLKTLLTKEDIQAERTLLLMHAQNFVKAAAQSDDKEIQRKASQFLQQMQTGQLLQPSLGLFARTAHSTETAVSVKPIALNPII